MKRRLEATLLGLILISIVPVAEYPSLRTKNASLAENTPQKVDDKGYSTDIKELRDRFNQDKGKVRIVLLLSPT